MGGNKVDVEKLKYDNNEVLEFIKVCIEMEVLKPSKTWKRFLAKIKIYQSYLEDENDRLSKQMGNRMLEEFVQERGVGVLSVEVKGDADGNSETE